jgi:pimeloyl-ACP methyl ester carboxylesterase
MRIRAIDTFLTMADTIPVTSRRSAMTRYVTSADGTRIAFDLFGDGSPVIVVGGILCDRQRTRQLAERLSDEGLSAINLDRRGRGESGNTLPYAVAREIEDLVALIDEVGGAAAVYGHSSGAGLALNAAASGLPITRLVLHEPPYGPDDEESTRGARELAETLRTLITANRRAEAIATFLSGAGLPPEMVEEASNDPNTLALAPTMLHDYAVMGDFDGGTIPRDVVQRVRIPTLVLAGGASPDFFRDTAEGIAGLLPNGRHVVLEGQDHGAPAEVVAPLVAEFIAPRSLAER